MKLILVVLCWFAAGNAKSSCENDLNGLVSDNPIDNLVKEALEYVRKLMQRHEPFSVGDIPTQRIQDNDPALDLTVTLTDVKVSNASDFNVKYIHNNLVGLWANFGVDEPQAHATGEYSINGTVLGKAVNGKGPFQLDVHEVDVNGYIEIQVVDHSVQMKNMELNYTLSQLKFDIQGLKVEGMTGQQLNHLFSDKLLGFFQQDEDFVSKKIARFIVQETNKICQGKTIQQLIEWLKNMIKS